MYQYKQTIKQIITQSILDLYGIELNKQQQDELIVFSKPPKEYDISVPCFKLAKFLEKQNEQ